VTQEKEFMELFNALEQFLRVEYNQDSYAYAGFMATIYRIRKANKNQIISNRYNFDIIQQASQIRNIIAHNNDVVLPTDGFMKKFSELVEKITNPIRVEHIMIPFSRPKTANLDNTIDDAVTLLKQFGFNTIPIINHGTLMGFFTEKSPYDYLSMNKNISINKSMTIKDILEACDLNSDPRRYFAFVNRKLKAEDAYDQFNKDSKARRELLLLLVTENGDPKEKLLGIVALRDIENALLA